MANFETFVRVPSSVLSFPAPIFFGSGRSKNKHPARLPKNPGGKGCSPASAIDSIEFCLLSIRRRRRYRDNETPGGVMDVTYRASIFLPSIRDTADSANLSLSLSSLSATIKYTKLQ